ncbi:MAG: ABC transporter ATP-binding protein [Microbacterium sp.]
MSERAVIQVERGAKSLPGGDPLLTDITFQVAAGQSAAILGRSGSGKSTLLGVLGLMDRLDSGRYVLDGRATDQLRARATDRARGETLGFVFQRFCLIPHLSVQENVEAPLLHRRGISARTRRRDSTRLLERVGLGSHLRKRPHQLSGGEQQRVAIARALVGRPRVLLADEPTGALDTTTASSVLELLLEQVRERGVSLILVTHDPLIAQHTSIAYRLHEGTLHPETRAA